MCIRLTCGRRAYGCRLVARSYACCGVASCEASVMITIRFQPTPHFGQWMARIEAMTMRKCACDTRSSIHSCWHERQRNAVFSRIMRSRYSGDHEHDHRHHHDPEQRAMAHRGPQSKSLRCVARIIAIATTVQITTASTTRPMRVQNSMRRHRSNGLLPPSAHTYRSYTK